MRPAGIASCLLAGALLLAAPAPAQAPADAAAGPAPGQLRRPQGAYELAGRLWNHAPAMFTALPQERLDWPRISAAEMGDLMAYLDADPRRDPAPDLGRGQLAPGGEGG